MPRSARILLSVLLTALAAAAPAHAAPSTEAERLAALRCEGVPGSARPLVLLIPGTGVNAEQNWSWGYARALRDEGRGVCTVDPPASSSVDVQDSVLYVRTAIEELARRDARPLSLIGHSQGAFHAVQVLRLFPELAPLVDDVIGLAGLYERGSDAIRADCVSRCIPPFWQVATGSRYMAALARRPLPAGPSYTAIGTLYDTVVTPQPAVNALTGGRAVQLQDVCPGRRVVGGVDHIYLAGDAVGHALAEDALNHPGPADPARIPPRTCLLQVLPGADLLKLVALGPSLALALAAPATGQVDAEPPLRCPLADGCTPAVAPPAVRLLGSSVDARRRVTLRLRATQPGRLRLRLLGERPGSTPSVALRRGTQTVRLPLRVCATVRGTWRCRALGRGRHRLALELRAAGARTWARALLTHLHVR